METAIDVQLLTHTPDPVRVMYVAFRTCYSRFTPQEIWADIESGKITQEKMKAFIFDKLKSGHSSPRTQVYFTFAVSGLSRSASHQLVRHNNGITFDQQSQRYYAFKEADFPYVVPETWEQAGLRDEYLAFMHRVGELYDQALKAGVPAEDARFLLPNAASTNLTFQDFDGGTLSYTYDPNQQVLTRTKDSTSETLLTGCDSLQFSIFQRRRERRKRLPK